MIRPRVLVDVALTLGLGLVLAELLWVEGKLAELQAWVYPVVPEDPSAWAEHPFGTQG